MIRVSESRVMDLPLMHENLAASFGGIFVMTLNDKSQVCKLVCLIKWKTASGTCIN